MRVLRREAEARLGGNVAEAVRDNAPPNAVARRRAERVRSRAGARRAARDEVSAHRAPPTAGFGRRVDVAPGRARALREREVRSAGARRPPPLRQVVAAGAVRGARRGERASLGHRSGTGLCAIGRAAAGGARARAAPRARDVRGRHILDAVRRGAGAAAVPPFPRAFRRDVLRRAVTSRRCLKLRCDAVLGGD